jgi:hypothetical protein
VIKIIAALCSLSSLANCHEQTVFDWDCRGVDVAADNLAYMLVPHWYRISVSILAQARMAIDKIFPSGGPLRPPDVGAAGMTRPRFVTMT